MLLKDKGKEDVEIALRTLQEKGQLEGAIHELFKITENKDWDAVLKLTEEMAYQNVLWLLDFRYLSGLGLKFNRENAQFYQQILKQYQAHWLDKEAWDKWYPTTNILAVNCYYYRAPLNAGFYYDQLMEHIDMVESSERVIGAVGAANHFMGVVQDYGKAAKYYEKAASFCSSAACRNRVYPNLAELYIRRNDFDRALEYANEILNSDSTSNSLRLRQLTRVGRIYYETGNKKAARKAYLQAEELLSKDEEQIWSNPFIKAEFAYVYKGLLELAIENKAWKNAKNYEDKLIALLQHITVEGQLTLMAVEQLLAYYLASNQPKEFMALNAVYKKEEEGYRSGQIAIYAKIETLRGDFLAKYQGPTLALQHYERALSLLKSKQKEGAAHQYTQNQPQALVTLSRKLDVLYRLYKKEEHSIAIQQSLYKTGQEAVLLLDQIRQGLSTQNSKLNVLEAAPRIYEYVLEATWKLYEKTGDESYLTYIYTLIEKSKAILLLETLNDGIAKEFGGVPHDLRAKEKQLRNDLKVYATQLNQVRDSIQIERMQKIIFDKRNALEKLKKNLEANYPKYYELKYQDNIAALEDVQRMLNSCDGIFVSYFIGKRNLYVLSITNSNVKVRVEALVGNRADGFIKDLVDFRNQLSDVNKASNWTAELHETFLKQGARFYQLLLEQELKGVNQKRLILSPDGLLHYLPFEALLTEVMTTAEDIILSELPYLVKKFATSYNYTATLWLQMMQKRKARQGTKGLLGIAASYAIPIEHPSQEWGRLRENLMELNGAKEEVQLLQEQYEGHFMIGKTATEATFKNFANDAQIIHLAMHGLVDNAAPMRSGLIFTEDADPKTENILFAYEISSLDLRADLVVLSACSTGDGLYKNGEGVMSLGRGFMYAGAASLLTTLWQINDQATERIMGTFYQKLSEGLPKDEALQVAKVRYLEEVSGMIGHPMFWSAYVMMGNIDSIAISPKVNWMWYLGGSVLLLLLLVVGLKKRK